MHPLFLETLMESIMETMMIPKVQVERVVGPILSMFLADVLTETLRDDPLLSGKIVMICPEFPLKKSDNNQSTNIDWLMYNSDRKQLLFIELKTTDSSFKASQNSIYLAKQDVIRRKGGSFLVEDIVRFRDASGESGKYQYILETKVSKFKTEIAECHDARLIYLVPKSAEHLVKSADRILNFRKLSNFINGPFAEEWKLIQCRLIALDDSSRLSRNHQVETRNLRNRLSKPKMVQKNWQGTLKFADMVKLCMERGNDIQIGFTGGRDEFSRRSLAELQKRGSYKWDYTKNWKKNQADWLTGTTVIELLK